MGKFIDPGLQKFIQEQEKKEQARIKAEQDKRKALEDQIASLKPKQKQQSSGLFDGIAEFNVSNNAMMDKVGGAKKYYKLPKSEQKKIQKEWQVTQQKEEKAKQAKIAQLQKQLDSLPKPKEKEPEIAGMFGGKIANFSKRQEYEKMYFNQKGAELRNMVDNVVASNPEKYGMKVTKGPNGYPIYTLTNKEKQAEMQAKLANAKTPKEKEAIKKKYEPLINAKVSDPRISLTSGGAGKYKNRISNAQGRAMMGPIQLGNFLEGKPYTDDHNKLGVKAKARHGDGGFLGDIGGAIGGAIGGISKASSKILSGVAKPVSTAIKTVGKGTEQIISSAARGDVKGLAKAGLNVVEGAKDVVQQTGSAGLTTALAPTGAIAGAVGIKPLEQITENIEREGQKGIDKYGDVAIDIGANIATGGTYGAAKGITAGLAEGGLGSLVSPEMITKYGVDAAASYYGVDPTMLQAGLAATKGDLKAAALQGMGSYAGFSPEQLNMATSLAEGDITEAGALAAGLDPNLIKDVTSGKFQSALTSGLTSGLAMAGGQAAAEAGIDPTTYNQAMDITKTITDPKARLKALQKLGSTAGLNSNQVSLLQAATSGDLEQEAISQAGGAAGLTKEQIQVGRTLASEGTRGLEDMAKQTATKITDKYMKDAAGRTIYGANNAPIVNPNYDQAAADMLQLERIQNTLPAAGETVQQYADRMGLDPNVILEQNAGRGLSLGKAIPRGMEISLPKGFTPPTPGQEEPGFFDTISQKAGDVWSSITGGDKKKPATGKEDKSFLDKAQDFISGNKNVIGAGVQAGSAYLGYKAGEEASEEVEKLTKQQLADIQAQGQPFMKITYDPERYKQERAFLQERIAKGGLTKEEEALQKQGDIRAARAAAAARLAGVEQQARMGGAAMGTSALASSLAGSQALLGEQSQTNLAREQAAAKNLESAIERRGKLSTQQTKEEADLAESQGEFGLTRTKAVGGVRGDLGNLELERAAALQRLYGKGADLATNVLTEMQPSQPKKTLPSSKPAGTKPPTSAPPVSNRTPAATTRPAPVTQPTQAATQPQQPSYQEYSIQRNDNLTKIAQRNNMTVDQLMAANPQIKDPNKIQAGAKLNIPSAQPSTDLQRRAGAAQQVSNKRQTGTTSTAKPTSGVVGETFNAINAQGSNVKDKVDKIKSGVATVQDIAKNKDKLLKNPKQALEAGKNLYALGKSLFGDEEA